MEYKNMNGSFYLRADKGEGGSPPVPVQTGGIGGHFQGIGACGSSMGG